MTSKIARLRCFATTCVSEARAVRLSLSAPRFGSPPRWSSRARLACLEGLVAANTWVRLRRKAR
eukprot:4154557-Alexandrium_andersonii.AAC.1